VPPVYPITLAEAKQHIKVEVTDDDALIALYIAAATKFAEGRTEAALSYAGWLGLYGTDDKTRPIPLRPQPIESVTKVESVAEDGTRADLTGYRLDTLTGLLYPPVDGWPVLPAQIGVTFKAGVQPAEGETVAPCEDDAHLALLLLIGEYYDHRASIAATATMPLPFGVDFLLNRISRVTGVVIE
jgi:uncharacterized phiE125 gp8 family phage protein